MTTTPVRDRTLTEDVDRRRTFAIISHPDAGKTTLTEKFLLFAGAVQQAGAVKSRRQARAAVSDWIGAGAGARDLGLVDRVPHRIRGRPVEVGVAEHRMRHEFGCDVDLAPALRQLARAVDPRDVGKVRGQRNTTVVYDRIRRHQTPLFLFASEHALQWAQQDHPDVNFRELGVVRDAS